MNIKKLFAKENLFFSIIFFASIVVLVVNRVLTGFSSILWISDFGLLFGVLYVVTTAKNNSLMFLFNLLTTLVMGVTSLIQDIYFSAFLAFFVTTPIIISGIIRNFKQKKTNTQRQISTLTKKQLTFCIGALVTLVPIIMFALYKLGSNLFYLDALASSLIILGMILFSRRYIEQFYFISLANVLYLIMYIILTFSNINNILYVVLNIIFTMMSIISIFEWRKMLHTQRQSLSKVEVGG